MNHGAKFVGPFVCHKISIGGYEVPNITIHRHSGEQDGMVSVVLDNRFGVHAVSEEEAGRWLGLIAHAMAIGAGYSGHGEHSQKMNPYKVQLGEITVGELGNKEEE